MTNTLSFVRSLLIKLGVLGVGVVVILWLGWSVPQANQRGVGARHLQNVSEEVNTRGSSHSLDINRATREELEALPGIGAVLANRIIERRESVGLFTAVEDLREIEGIGEIKLAQLKTYFTLNQTANNESNRIPKNHKE